MINTVHRLWNKITVMFKTLRIFLKNKKLFMENNELKMHYQRKTGGAMNFS